MVSTADPGDGVEQELKDLAEFGRKIDKRMTKRFRRLQTRHRFTARFKQDRWEEMVRNAQYLDMDMNAYVNMCVENYNKAIRRQRHQYLQARERREREEGEEEARR